MMFFKKKIPPPTVLKKNVQKILSSSFSSKCRLNVAVIYDYHNVKFQRLLTDAANVAIDQMLQEDFSHPITKALSWYACHLYWKNPPQATVDEEGEEAEHKEAEGEVCHM